MPSSITKTQIKKHQTVSALIDVYGINLIHRILITYFNKKYRIPTVTQQAPTPLSKRANKLLKGMSKDQISALKLSLIKG